MTTHTYKPPNKPTTVRQPRNSCSPPSTREVNAPRACRPRRLRRRPRAAAAARRVARRGGAGAARACRPRHLRRRPRAAAAVRRVARREGTQHRRWRRRPFAAHCNCKVYSGLGLMCLSPRPLGAGAGSACRPRRLRRRSRAAAAVRRVARRGRTHHRRWRRRPRGCTATVQVG